MSNIKVPGEMIADKPLRLDNTFIENGKTYAAVIGTYDSEKRVLVPLEGLWYPRRDDVAIGVIEEKRSSTYSVQLNAPYRGLIISKFEETEFDIGDVLEASVRNLEEGNTVVLTRPKKLEGGAIIDVKPSKMPRIIGKENTMLKQLVDGTKSTIKVGMNGRIWIKGGNTFLAIEAILKIKDEAHTQGLTNRIKEFLQSAKTV